MSRGRGRKGEGGEEWERKREVLVSRGRGGRGGVGEEEGGTGELREGKVGGEDVVLC